MKKVLFVCMAFALGSLTNTTNAQAIKIGSFDEETVLSLMPGVEKIDSLLDKYVTDSLKPEYDSELEMLKTKEDLLKSPDTAKKSESWKKTIQGEVTLHRYKLANWQQYQQQKVSAKQQQFLRPYMEKIYDALRVIIQEQKYTHVFKKDAFIWADKDAELMLRVIIKMKLPASKEAEEQLKALLAPATPAATGTKPAPKKP